MSKRIERVDVEVFVIVDENGDYAVGKTPQLAAEQYEADIQSLSEAECTRAVKVTLSVPQPSPVELKGVVPVEATDAAELVAVE